MKIHSNLYGVWSFTIEIYGVSSDPITMVTNIPEKVNLEIMQQPSGVAKEEVTKDNYFKICEKSGNYLPIVISKTLLIFQINYCLNKFI